MAIEALDAAATRGWCQAGVAALSRARAAIDAVNVFPVADGDTGTNLLLTMEAAAKGAAEATPPEDLAATCAAMSRGALLGARGSSGIILSQLLRGMTDVLATSPAPRGEALRDALERAADLAYTAVGRPVEGTMLTVARAAAAAARAAAPGRAGTRPADLATVAGAAAGAARTAVAGTTAQLEVLRRAGVVDAGAHGLAVLFDALAAVVTGVPSDPALLAPPHPAAAAHGACAPADGGDPQPYDGPAYEVMYLLDAPAAEIDGLRRTLSALGEALVVVGGDGLWNVHVHADDAGAAVEAGLGHGRLHRIRITHLAGASHAAAPPAGSPPADAPHADAALPGAPHTGPTLDRRALVAVAAGDGMAALLAQAGAAVVAGGPGRRPSATTLLTAMREAATRAAATEVVVVPNDVASLSVAEVAARAARAAGLRAAVIPARASVQALAAIAVHDAGRDFDSDVVAMTAAAGHTRHGGVTVAMREAVTTVGVCQPGDVLGVIDGDFALVGHDLVEAACEVVDRMVGAGGEMVTLLVGADAPADLAEAVVRHLHQTRPEVDTAVHEGGQPRYPLLIGVE